ncbi:hypothetical protein PsorP6_015852 [Peronosclerospora sorghi]|uniref:Uncharacterized protein n=1 Tax=Peronosclerospora sorghi TaxID=230839 RepID=A0ACC0WQV7_9STRA|nr:hypothetical protein PsorP6_015852 [Peronosclerospora sorghi]
MQALVLFVSLVVTITLLPVSPDRTVLASTATLCGALHTNVSCHEAKAEERGLQGVDGTHTSLYKSIMWVVDRLKRQLQRLKWKLQKKGKVAAFDETQGLSVSSLLRSSETRERLLNVFRTEYEQRKLCELLLERYKDRRVVEALVDAQQATNEQMKDTATLLLHRVLEVYRQGGYTAVNVFHKIGISATEFVLIDAKLPVVMSYLELVNKKGKSPPETLLDVLTNVFQVKRRLVESIGVTRSKGVHKDIVEAVEQGLLAKWKTQELDPSKLLSELRLGENMNKLLQSPALDTVWKYIEQYNQEKKPERFSLLAWCMEKFDYPEVKDELIKAKKSKVPKETVKELYDEFEATGIIYKPKPDVF